MKKTHILFRANCRVPSFLVFRKPFKTILVGGLEHGLIIFHFFYGMPYFPLTNSIIFQDVFLTTNQSLKPTIQPSFNQQPAIDPPKKEAVLGV
jgi:hypothetical protein